MKKFEVWTKDGIHHALWARKLIVSEGVIKLISGPDDLVALFPVESVMALIVMETKSDKSDT